MFLLTQMKLGASARGIAMWLSSTPLDVLTNSKSPAAVTEQLHMLCWDTPSWFIMSSFQIDVGFVLDSASAHSVTDRRFRRRGILPCRGRRLRRDW